MPFKSTVLFILAFSLNIVVPNFVNAATSACAANLVRHVLRPMLIKDLARVYRIEDSEEGSDAANFEPGERAERIAKLRTFVEAGPLTTHSKQMARTLVNSAGTVVGYILGEVNGSWVGITFALDSSLWGHEIMEQALEEFISELRTKTKATLVVAFAPEDRLQASSLLQKLAFKPGMLYTYKQITRRPLRNTMFRRYFRDLDPDQGTAAKRIEFTQLFGAVKKSQDHFFDLLISNQEELAKIYADPQKSPSEKARLSFEFIFNLRLSTLEESIASAVRKASVPENWNVSFDPNGKAVGGRFNGVDKAFDLFIPTSLLGTELEYAIKIHELEHLIQILMREKALAAMEGPHAEALRQFSRESAHVVFLNEDGAMRSEWAIFSTMPEADRLKFLASAHKMNLDPEIYKILESGLTFASANVDEYIAHEHRGGRYSRKAVNSKFVGRVVLD